MLLRATKDDHEREEDEAERLVRPAPKVKPPRRDRRRETIQSELDSDTSGDPDLTGDKDLSLNYKTIGGSASIVARYLSGKSNIKYVSVIDTQAKDPAKQVTSIPEDTAKANPSRYKIQKGPESQTPADSAETPKPGAPAGSPPPFEGSAYHQDTRKQLQDLEKSDPKAKAFLDAAKKPGGQIYEIAKKNPSLLLPSLSFKLPSVVRTFGDLVTYLEPKAKTPEAPAAKPPGAKKSPAETPAAKPSLPEAPRPDPERSQSLRFLSDAQRQDQEGVNKFLLDLPTIDRRQGDGALVIYDKKTKTRVPINQASTETLKEVVSQYTKHKLEADLKQALSYHTDKPEVQQVLKDLAFLGGKTKEQGEEEGKLASRLRDLQKQGYPLEALSISKHIPELKDVALPDSVKSVKDIVDLVARVDLVPKAKPEKGKAPEAKADGKDKPAPEKSSEQRVVERFKQEKLQSPDFNEYVRGLPTTDEDAEGNVLFLDKSTKPKKHVPFDKLPLQAQKEVIAQFDGVQKNQARTKAIQELASSDPKLRALLAEVATLKGKSRVEPEAGSALERLTDLQSQGFSLDELPIKKHLPELSGVTLPEDIATVADLIQAAQAVVPAAPKRPAVSEEEATRIRDLLSWGLGSDRAAQLSSLHPKDQENIISQWETLRRKDDPSKDKQFFKDLEVIRGGVDIASIEPPKKVAWKGKEVDYDRLSSQDKAEALQAYRNRLTAVKLVGQDLYKDMLADRVPAPLVSVLTTEGKKTPPVQVFKDVLTDGVEEPPLPAKELKRLFKDLSPDSWPTVAAYFQARDLQDAHKRYLQTNAINEQLPVRDIVRQLQSATDDLRERDRLYPEGMSLNTAADFRRLTLRHLENLARQGSMNTANYRSVRRWCQTVDADDYDSALAKWKSRGEEVSQSGGLDQWPLQPEKPEGYDQIRGATHQNHSAPRPSGLWSKLKNLMTPARPQSRVAFRYLSTCTDVRLMSASTRTAVYWGVAPYPTDHEGFAPYNEWEQSHARDWSEKDAETLLDAAKEWLKSDLLSLAMEGSDPDVAYRAALDLAIRVTDDGKYSMGLPPGIYNELLAKLAGKPVGETLLTIREASTFPYNLGGGSDMKTSAQLCRIAATLAESDSFSNLAFDLIHLSHKVAKQEQGQDQDQDDMQDASQSHPADLDQGQQKQAYIALRRAVIRTAKNNPQVRQAFLPVLKLIQQLG